MADDDQEKTEEPTQKKLDDARKKGQVAFSREVSNFFIILTFAIIVAMLIRNIFQIAADRLNKYLQKPHDIAVEYSSMEALTTTIVYDALAIITLPFILFVIAAITASVIQNGFNISVESIKPKLEKISLKKGVKRLFSSRSMMEFGKGILKIIIVGLISFFTIMSEMDKLSMVPSLEIDDLMLFISHLSLKVLIAVTVVVFLIAVIDFIYQKKEHIKQLRMSKQEIKDEYKKQEGDPLIKAKLKGIRLERSRQRMMQSVPDADVVITNPTHFAVALKYEHGSMQAPVLVAKGQDEVAERIKKLADKSEVPIVRNAPLARSLHSDCEIDAEIPLEHYQAVAEVISYVMGMKNPSNEN